ncbi:MAG: casein kinase 2 substrate [Monoraphidium minutum]|nr:MAG: casein kinase 2 substrate [Monoraphidium minutum]
MDALRQQATKAAAAYRDWTALHARSAAALATAVNILSRLQALQDAAHFQGLGCGPELQREVLGRQLQAFDAALAGAHEALCQMQGAVRELERAALEAAKRGGGLPLAAAARRRGPEPSPAEVVEALQDAWRMCRDELVLKQTAVGLVTFGSSPEDAAALLACYEAQPNVDTPRIEAFLRQMAETAPRKPL